jgi:hypothetical protein
MATLKAQFPHSAEIRTETLPDSAYSCFEPGTVALEAGPKRGRLAECLRQRGPLTGWLGCRDRAIRAERCSIHPSGSYLHHALARKSEGHLGICQERVCSLGPVLWFDTARPVHRLVEDNFTRADPPRR